jgi:chromosome segregation ATPase
LSDDASKKAALDRKLSTFLESVDDDARAGHTIANLRLEISSFARRLRTTEAHVEALRSEHAELRADHEEHVASQTEFQGEVLERLGGAEGLIEAHTDVLVRVKKRLRTGDPDDEMVTGNHDLRSMQVALEEAREKGRDKRTNSMRVEALEHAETERKENATWLKRHAFTVVTGVLVALFLMFVTALVTLAATGARQSVTPVLVPVPGTR